MSLHEYSDPMGSRRRSPAIRGRRRRCTNAGGGHKGTPLGPVDTYFVTQTSLGTPFQVDAGRVAEAKGTTQAIRSYADLMVSSHIAVNNALLAVLKTKAPVPPPTLLQAAYATMVATLQHEKGRKVDADYIRGQVAYQNANAALYKYEIAQRHRSGSESVRTANFTEDRRPSGTRGKAAR